MALFQASVLKSHLALLYEVAVDKAYKKYQKYFWNTAIQENIKNAKEEQYQATFLNELFVNILGYTLFPNPNSNLTTEFKNEKNARKADGAILNNDIAIGVIELKGTKTKDLESIRKQAFDYKANQKGCVYVITSNFEKLRFYINDATEFEEFNLFELSLERFSLLYLCLQKDNILNNVPLKIKEASIVEEEQITKKFYKDYSLFKRELYRDLVKRNVKQLKLNSSLNTSATQSEEQKQIQLKLEKNVKLTLFKKSQKLIDRYLFIFFAEDRGLLPPNSTQQILNKWKADIEFGDERPLYNLFKQYFKFLDQGRAGTGKRAEIYAYNGGLFKEDTLLDNLQIDSELLYKYTKQLAGYDFESQVDVNILGHIFENSLNEIESVNAEIEGGDFDKQKSKRKKDGVFYTPKYITKYIVENTIGKLCIEKKTELGFKEEEYFKGRKSRNKSTIATLVNTLDTYRDWLLQLTICDPACGSGAFLNQALDFLIKEHNYIDELKTKVLGGGFQFPDIETTILENNIYGVDLNEESVEIAKLSLWLRTAQPRRKLNDLSSNIKCGNSLIDSKAVAGDKAFNWETQFSKIFEKGGFDVVIGNPPWGAKLGAKAEELLGKKYPEVPSKLKDSYMYFMLLCIDIIKKNSFYGLIVPNTWLLINNTSDFRKKLLSYDVKEITDHGDGVFQDAVVESATIFLRKDITNKGKVIAKKYQKGEIRIDHSINKRYWLEDELHRIVIELKEFDYQLIKKMELKSNRFDFNCEIIFGIKPYQVGHGKPKQTREQVTARIFHSNQQNETTWKPLVTGTDVNKYFCDFHHDCYIKYGEWLMYSSNETKILSTKILLRRTSSDLRAVVDETKYYPQNSLFIITSTKNIYYLCGLINSKLFDRIYKAKCPQVGKVFAEVKPSIIKSMPIAEVSVNQENEIGNLVVVIQNQMRQFKKHNHLFSKYLLSKFSLEKLSKKLQNWHELEFGNFIKELNKAIKSINKLREKNAIIDLGEKEGKLKECTPFEIIPTLTKKDEFEWLDLFEENKQKARALQAEINQTDKEIDAMVYELYGLSEDEIKIVENS